MLNSQHKNFRRNVLKATRRRFISGAPVGLMLLAAPWVRVVHAQGLASKPRFVSLFTPLGQMDEWLPVGTSNTFSFTEISEPLTPYKDKLIVTTGVNSKHGNHAKGALGMFTAGSPLGADKKFKKAQGPSIDTYLADALGAKRIAVGSNAINVTQGWITFRQDGSPQAQQNNVKSVFDSVFAGAAPGGGNSQSNAAAELLRLQRLSILDAWQEDIGDLNKALGAEHKVQLDHHLTAIRELEQSLDEAPSSNFECDDKPNVGTNSTGNSYVTHGINGDKMGTLIASALACGRIQVASMMWSRGGASSISWQALTGIRDNHHSLTHADLSGPVNASVNQARADEGLRKIYRWYSERVADFFGKLDAIPHGNGTLLDSTIIVWGSEVGYYRSHAANNRRVVIAGNYNNHFQSGRYYQFNDQVGVGQIHAEVATALGVPTDKFGADSGQLPQLRA